MPTVPNGPKALNNLLESAYNSCMADDGNATYCSKVAWTAAKNAGWKQDDDGNWVKKIDKADKKEIDDQFIVKPKPMASIGVRGKAEKSIWSDVLKIEKIEKKMGPTTLDDNHYHEYVVDKGGDGLTTSTIGSDSPHSHNIENWEVLDAHGHIHKITKTTSTNKSIWTGVV